MIRNPFYEPPMQGAFVLHDLGPLILECGETLRGAKLACRTFGTLNADKTNAVLVTTWFSGTGKVMQDVYVGAGHALDPAKYFIVIVDQLGSGVSSSPHNTPGRRRWPNSPGCRSAMMSMRRHAFCRRLSASKGWPWLSAGRWAGSRSMNGLCRGPAWWERAAPIACTARISPLQKVFVETLKEAITSDPAWRGGWYANGSDLRDGMDRMARIVATAGWSAEFYTEERWPHGAGHVLAGGFYQRRDEGLFRTDGPPCPADADAQMAARRCRAPQPRRSGGGPGADHGENNRHADQPRHVLPPAEAEADCRLIPGADLKLINSVEGHMGLNGFEPGYMARWTGSVRPAGPVRGKGDHHAETHRTRP